MLAVAVDGDEPVVTGLGRPRERAAEARAVAEVPGVADHLDGGELAETLGRHVGRAVVDDEHVAGVTEDLRQDRGDVRLLVVDGDGGQDAHRGEGPFKRDDFTRFSRREFGTFAF